MLTTYNWVFFFSSRLRSLSLIGIFRPLTFKVIIDTVRLTFTVFVSGFYLLPLLFVSIFSFHTFPPFYGFNCFLWFHFLSFLSILVTLLLFFFFSSGCPRICNICLQLIQIHFQILFHDGASTLEWQNIPNCSLPSLLPLLSFILLIHKYTHMHTHTHRGTHNSIHCCYYYFEQTVNC